MSAEPPPPTSPEVISARLMTARGQKRRFHPWEGYVCFSHNFGHSSAWPVGLFRAKSGCERSQQAAVAVGMRVTSHPPHRSVRAAFPHTVPTSGHDGNCLPYASQRLCHADPVLRPVRALLTRLPLGLCLGSTGFVRPARQRTAPQRAHHFVRRLHSYYGGSVIFSCPCTTGCTRLPAFPMRARDSHRRRVGQAAAALTRAQFLDCSWSSPLQRREHVLYAARQTPWRCGGQRDDVSGCTRGGIKCMHANDGVSCG